jgi:probable HAF family extracellular repeat protein
MQKLWWFIKNGIAYYSSIKKITVVLCLFTVNILYPQQSPPGISFPPGYTSGSVTDVSGDGSVLVGSILPDGSSDTKPFRFISNNFEILPQLGTDYSSAVAIARDTMMIAGYSIVATHPQAWRVDPESQIVALGHLANDNSSTPYDISGDGNIIVGWSYGRGGSDGEAFLWEEGEGMTGLGTLSQTNQGSAAHGVSADGSVVVGLSHIDTGEWRAFRWTQGTGIQNLGILPGYDQSQADYVSDDGQVIVGFSSKNGTADNQIFRWVSGTMTGLGNYGGGSWSVIQYVSPTGSIIVATSSEFTTVVWDEQNGWRSLEDVWESNFGVQIQGWDNQLMVGGISVNDSIWAGNGWSQANGNQLWIVGSNNSSVAWSNGNGGSFNLHNI